MPELKTTDTARLLTPAEKLAALEVSGAEYARALGKDHKASYTRSLMQELEKQAIDKRIVPVTTGKFFWNLSWSKVWEGGRARLSTPFQEVSYSTELLTAKSQEVEYFPKGYHWPLPEEAKLPGVKQRRVHVYMEYADPLAQGHVLVHVSDTKVNGCRHWSTLTIWDVLEDFAREHPVIVLLPSRKFFYSVRNAERDIRIGPCSAALPPPLSLACRRPVWGQHTDSLDNYHLVISQVWQVNPIDEESPAGVRWEIPVQYRSVAYEEALPARVYYDTKGDIKDVRKE
jgi:hypothetical protein